MRKLAAYMGVLITIGVALYLIPSWKQTDFYVKALPSQLQTEGFVTSGSDYGLFSALTLSREACGAVVFKLTSGTIAAIRQNGLSFFDGAQQGRGYPSEAYHHYAPWRATPAPSEWFGDGAVADSLGCAQLDKDLVSRITAGGRSPGGYFTATSEGELIVLPDDGIAVLAYDG